MLAAFEGDPDATVAAYRYFLPRPLNGLSPAGFITMHCAENNQFRTDSQANELFDG